MDKENAGFVEKSTGDVLNNTRTSGVASHEEDLEESEGFQNSGRLYRSSVHEHFDKVSVPHPSTKMTVAGSTCKYCAYTLINRVSTNLKNHLKFKHPEVFEEVKRKIVTRGESLESSSIEIESYGYK